MLKVGGVLSADEVGSVHLQKTGPYEAFFFVDVAVPASLECIEIDRLGRGTTSHLRRSEVREHRPVELVHLCLGGDRRERTGSRLPALHLRENPVGRRRDGHKAVSNDHIRTYRH